MKRIWLARLVLALAAPIVAVAILEILLRLLWSNPYRPAPPVDEYRSRLETTWSRASANVAALYEGGGTIYGEHTRFRSLSSGGVGEPTPVLALGGSTTETALVPEGERWPDLLEPPAMNYGVNDNCVVDSQRNLQFLFEETGLRPARVLVMHAVNDLTEILRAADNFGLELLPHRPLYNPLEAEAESDVLGVPVGDSWLLSFLSFNLYERIGRDLTRAAPPSDLPDDAPLLTDVQIEALTAYVQSMLPVREEVFVAMRDLARGYGAELFLMTQPHAMRPDYQPYRVERRMRRFLGSQFMTHEQHAGLLGLMNDHTREVAERLGTGLIDVAACFRALDPTPLFYDGVHYTHAGSKAVARCVNEELPPLSASSASTDEP